MRLQKTDKLGDFGEMWAGKGHRAEKINTSETGFGW